MQHASLTVMTLMYLVFISRFWQNLHCGLLHFISVRSLHADTNFCCHSSVYGLSSSARTALTCADLPVCAGWTAAGWTAAGWTAADWTAAGWCAAGSTAAPERISAISAGAASSRACVSTWESSQHTAEQAQSKRYRGIFRLHCWIIRRGNLYTEIQRATGPEGDLRRTRLRIHPSRITARRFFSAGLSIPSRLRCRASFISLSYSASNSASPIL